MEFDKIVAAQRACFNSGRTRPLAFRRARLMRLKEMLVEAEGDLLDALYSDLGKSGIEAYTSEIGFVSTDIDYALKHLAGWMKPRRFAVPPMAWPATSLVLPEPLGVALIIGPWNYPLQLLLSPLVAAIAAGNCACLKPSEHAPATGRVLAREIGRLFPSEEVAIVCGDADVAAGLLRERFDKIFFTGGSRVGRLVMRAAAEHMTPLTLELGGKSPCIVCDDARVGIAARRIIWGKCLNAGQTCVSPDYLLVDVRVCDRLVEAMRMEIRRFYPDGAAAGPDYGRIVNESQFRRLTSYLDQGEIIEGGGHDAARLFIEPTLLGNVSLDAPVMQEEIFGPILPVIPVDGIVAALDFVKSRPRPLALYCFTGNRATRALVTGQTSSGGVCFNDTIAHIAGKALPFGGVGESGMGRYRGKAGFDEFSNAKSVMVRGTWLDMASRYPPARMSLATIKKAYRFMVGA